MNDQPNYPKSKNIVFNPKWAAFRLSIYRGSSYFCRYYGLRRYKGVERAFAAAVAHRDEMLRQIQAGQPPQEVFAAFAGPGRRGRLGLRRAQGFGAAGSVRGKSPRSMRR
ncbi:MAG: hypothetical protein ACI4OS_02870 [Akkermansia sp.]